MRLFHSAGFTHDFERLPPDIRRKVIATLDRFASDPHHPSLRFKKLETRDDIWSIRVTRSYRITMTIEGDLASLRHAGPHDEVYRRP